MENPNIIKQASEFVFTLFKEKLSKKLVYHNYRHTLETVTVAEELGQMSGLEADELQDLVLAGWFHDTGYVEAYEGHEEESIRFATDWLQEQGYPAERIQRIADCIMATKHKIEPVGLLQEILVDADLSNIGKPTFSGTAELLRVEWEIFLDKFFSDSEWAQFQMDFLLSTTFRTSQAQHKFAAQLGLNIQEQRESLNKALKKKKKSDKKKRETLAQPKRGIETMFRNTYRTHLDLSAIADNKANMMISLNAIIMSVVITYLSAKSSVIGVEFTQHRTLIVPIGMLLLTTLGSVVFAIISAQPEITSFSFKKKNKNRTKITSRNVNLLFFGNFTKLPLEDFQAGMQEIMRDKKSLYNNMITDIYYLGEVLSRKYKILRISYTIFMVGLVLTVVGFGIAVASY
ncbi:putative metal-dependent HD superfamily phosphohydrolase [Pontibacter ummariensis]|uniref:Predicted metal-dependent phosphohydrolase, HD superfamily n=1 Tax=Pontibacter ummariensis TaxID=1610492 RepID=A0A239IH45_9BACT|nr:Pycsar system effector family protein [Pontibacter ummariensis]PRY09846.1 putative metal-dependent HD superfamily phosphohydrolase [Pontibacter ummariensis]SNS92885.1 Predicted metal-dependent phosphohydrolase, HD superfamily [Pontibacter ummariensis]